jgi:hypothetical protein
VVACFGFDTDAERLMFEDVAVGDTSIVPEPIASGTGAMRMAFASSFGAAPGNGFSLALPDSFGPGSQTFYQLRLRVTPTFLTEDFGYSGVRFMKVTTTSGQILAVTAGAAEGFAFPTVTDFFQSVLDASEDESSAGLAQDGCNEADPSACVRFVADEWMTLQLVVRLGAINPAAGAADSRVELWFAREGCPQRKLVDAERVPIPSPKRPALEANTRINGLDFVIDTAHNEAATNHAATTIWMDELIVATSFVADPKVQGARSDCVEAD